MRYMFGYLIYFQLDISVCCLVLGIFRNSGYRSILAGELAIREEPSHELVDPPIFAPGHPAVQLADREEFGMPEVLRGVVSAQTDDICIDLAEPHPPGRRQSRRMDTAGVFVDSRD